MDDRSRILDRLRPQVGALARETAVEVLAEVRGFGPVRDEQLAVELLTLAEKGIGLLVEVMTRGAPPTDAEMAFLRARAALRARQLVPLSALLHSYLIANRVVVRAIAREATSGDSVSSAALELTAEVTEYTLLTTTTMADAYLETAQGDLADLERQRAELLAGILSGAGGAIADLRRRAVGLGLQLERDHVVVVAAVRGGAPDRSQRWAAEAISRTASRPDWQPFVVIRGDEVVAVLMANRPQAVLEVIQRAAAVLHESRGEVLMAGIGPVFSELVDLRTSYEEARRALRHAGITRPFVLGPDDVRLFDELTVAAGGSVAGLISEGMRSALLDRVLRASLEAFWAANLNVAGAAKTLHIHPNTLRYRLGRIAERTGRDPHVLADLFELTTAARLIAAQGSQTTDHQPPRQQRREPPGAAPIGGNGRNGL